MVGDTLRKEREKKNLTIADVERETSISKRYLEALEKGDYASMPGDVYIKGFIRNYSKLLEIDGTALLAEFASERGIEKATQPVDVQGANPKEEKPLNINDLDKNKDAINIKVTKTKSSERKSGGAFSSGNDFRDRVEGGRNRAKKIAMALFAMVIVFLGGVYVAFSEDDSAPPAPKPDTATTQQVAKVEETKVEDTKPVVKADEVKVEVKLSDRCWMQVLVDGDVAFEGTAEPGLEMDWTGKNDVFITAGNAGAVDLTWNGKNVGVLGSAGQVVERHMTKDSDGTVAKPAADKEKSAR